MRDIIWTIIIIWLIFRVTDVFRGFSKKKVGASQSAQNEERGPTPATSHNEQEIKSALQKHLNNEGEYVDFEEMK